MIVLYKVNILNYIMKHGEISNNSLNQIHLKEKNNQKRKKLTIYKQ